MLKMQDVIKEINDSIEQYWTETLAKDKTETSIPLWSIIDSKLPQKELRDKGWNSRVVKEANRVILMADPCYGNPLLKDYIRSFETSFAVLNIHRKKDADQRNRIRSVSLNASYYWEGEAYESIALQNTLEQEIEHAVCKTMATGKSLFRSLDCEKRLKHLEDLLYLQIQMKVNHYTVDHIRRLYSALEQRRLMMTDRVYSPDGDSKYEPFEEDDQTFINMVLEDYIASVISYLEAHGETIPQSLKDWQLISKTALHPVKQEKCDYFAVFSGLGEWEFIQDNEHAYSYIKPLEEAKRYEVIRVIEDTDSQTAEFIHQVVYMDDYTEEEWEEVLKAFGYASFESFVLEGIHKPESIVYLEDGRIDRVHTKNWYVDYKRLVSMLAETMHGRKISLKEAVKKVQQILEK